MVSDISEMLFSYRTGHNSHNNNNCNNSQHSTAQTDAVTVTRYSDHPLRLSCKNRTCLHVQVVANCWHRLRSMEDRDATAEAAALSVIRVVLSAARPNPQLQASLSGADVAVSERSTPGRRPPGFDGAGGVTAARGVGLVDELIDVAGGGKPSLRAEALAVLAAVARRYCGMLEGEGEGALMYWEVVFEPTVQGCTTVCSNFTVGLRH